MIHVVWSYCLRYNWPGLYSVALMQNWLKIVLAVVQFSHSPHTVLLHSDLIFQFCFVFNRRHAEKYNEHSFNRLVGHIAPKTTATHSLSDANIIRTTECMHERDDVLLYMERSFFESYWTMLVSQHLYLRAVYFIFGLYVLTFSCFWFTVDVCCVCSFFSSLHCAVLFLSHSNIEYWIHRVLISPLSSLSRSLTLVVFFANMLVLIHRNHFTS